MTHRPASRSSSSAIRSDLQIVPLPGARDYLVIDDITGRFSKTKSGIWRRIRSWASTPSTDHESQAIWQQATAAGWIRSRSNAKSPAWSPLSIKIPVASIDPLAKRLAPYSDLVFSPKAILFWAFAAMLGIFLLVLRWEHWSGSVPSLAKYLSSMDPIGLAATFVLTKTVHELGHAVVCRRMGSRCGIAGMWLLCFMPCPYVDVTEVWRQPNPLRRAAVMAAGMAAEGVVCVTAVWVWLLTDSPTVQLAAMNLILVGSVSTLLFNANPLMRYDGYFILSDLIDSTNMRQEAAHAWHRILTLPLRQWLGQRRRVWSLVVYFFASNVYRGFIFIAIAAMILAVADQWGLWRIAALVVTLIAVRTVGKGLRGLVCLNRGTGKWSVVPRHRRWVLLLGSFALVGGVLLTPLPRYRHIQGCLEAKDVHAVFLPGAGVIDATYVRLGDLVSSGQSLASVKDDSLAMELASVAGKAKLLSLRSRSLRLASLSGLPNDAPSDQWDVVSQAYRAAEERKIELVREQDRLDVRSPADGIVLRGEHLQRDPTNGVMNEFRLSPGRGEAASNAIRWCRIAYSGRLRMSMPLDADDHNQIRIGTRIRFHIPGHLGVIGPVEPLCDDAVPRTASENDAWFAGSSNVGRSCIVAVSPIQRTTDENEIGEKRTYQAVSEVCVDVGDDLEKLARLDGAVCEVIVHLPARPIWNDVADAMRELSGI